jgi:hypothetical protein
VCPALQAVPRCADEAEAQLSSELLLRLQAGAALQSRLAAAKWSAERALEQVGWAGLGGQRPVCRGWAHPESWPPVTRPSAGNSERGRQMAPGGAGVARSGPGRGGEPGARVGRAGLANGGALRAPQIWGRRCALPSRARHPLGMHRRLHAALLRLAEGGPLDAAVLSASPSSAPPAWPAAWAQGRVGGSGEAAFAFVTPGRTPGRAAPAAASSATGSTCRSPWAEAAARPLPGRAQLRSLLAAVASRGAAGQPTEGPDAASSGGSAAEGVARLRPFEEDLHASQTALRQCEAGLAEARHVASNEQAAELLRAQALAAQDSELRERLRHTQARAQAEAASAAAAQEQLALRAAAAEERAGRLAGALRAAAAATAEARAGDFAEGCQTEMRAAAVEKHCR